MIPVANGTGIKWVCAAALSMMLATAASAQTVPAAEQLVRNTTERVLEALTSQRQVIEQDPGRVFGIVDDFILPHFDFEKMSQRVLGKFWNRATPTQKTQFTKEFQVLLVRTYATALREYSDQVIEYLPSREREGGAEVTVRTQIRQPGAPPIPISYDLHRVSDAWKVFDVTIDGVSLVINYRSTFATEIRNNGIDGLIDRLAKHNSERD